MAIVKTIGVKPIVPMATAGMTAQGINSLI